MKWTLTTKIEQAFFSFLVSHIKSAEWKMLRDINQYGYEPLEEKVFPDIC